MNVKYEKIKRYLDIVGSTMYPSTTNIECIFSAPSGYKTSNTPPADEEFKPFNYGDRWEGGADSHIWFKLCFSVPEEYKNMPVQLWLYSGARKPQMIVYKDGKMIQGIDGNHQYVYLDSVEGEQTYYVYVYTGHPNDVCPFKPKLRTVSVPAMNLYYDIKTPFRLLDCLDENSYEYSVISTDLEAAVSMLYLIDVGSQKYYESVENAVKYLRETFYNKHCRTSPTTAFCVGHTHIDCAWLWTLEQTREKVQRSFSTVINLMKQYPEYKFTSSQPLLYKFLKEEAPDVYEEVKKMVKEGRWECEGAMWVEADCNLPSGESLVRQIIHGKNFFMDEFGVESRVLWLPDVFGYSAALPQILKKCGVDWFVTSKISWNDTNMMPYDTFKWVGIDGTDVNTYFLTAQDLKRNGIERYTTYSSSTRAPQIGGTYKRYQQKDLTDKVMLTYGFGDGGGGPTDDMMEMFRRVEKGIPGIPGAEMGFAGDFLKELAKNMENSRHVPKWQGELYLEFHRGTYTSNAKNKKNNRRSEFLYMQAELLSVIADKLLGKPFPKDELHHGWEMILTNQFHDIIPGSSIGPVYDQCDIDYKEIMGIGNKIVNDASSLIAENIAASEGYVVFNPNSFETDGFAVIDGKTVKTKGKIPSKGYAATNDFICENNVKIDGYTVENDVMTVKFNENWQICSIYDKKADREVLKAGELGNVLRIYPDFPNQYDAWEWQEYSLEEFITLDAFENLEIIDDGARRGIKVTRPHMESTITQTAWFTDGSMKIEFETVADWHQPHQMVKAVFPVDINTDTATYEIQYGNIKRPTHFNTTWDKAKFEVCGHKYADVSEGGYGVSIINDCKYGHDIHNSIIQLSLFKCPTEPYNGADIGVSSFTYAILPHAGALNDSDTVKEAYYLNMPMSAVKATGAASSIPTSFSAASTSEYGIICECVKQAERSEDTIMRVYECQNVRRHAVIDIGFDVKTCTLCDLMENPIRELEIKDGKVALDMGGFEIITLKLA